MVDLTGPRVGNLVHDGMCGVYECFEGRCAACPFGSLRKMGEKGEITDGKRFQVMEINRVIVRPNS